ncbi:MAG: hypothetical protein WKF58_05935 [Ilumatobacteraceae bacterium]
MATLSAPRLHAADSPTELAERIERSYSRKYSMRGAVAAGAATRAPVGCR